MVPGGRAGARVPATGRQLHKAGAWEQGRSGGNEVRAVSKAHGMGTTEREDVGQGRAVGAGGCGKSWGCEELPVAGGGPTSCWDVSKGPWHVLATWINPESAAEWKPQNMFES